MVTSKTGTGDSHVCCLQITPGEMWDYMSPLFGVLDPSCWASLVAQTVKNLLEMQETWVQSLGREDPLEKGMGTHSSILA